ncbi:hypothetical protein Pelo_19543 [Pelomyxa schiedti]|nr:hypothetical protein Pelo_19543 [Pelomyxa schiedti]
MSSSSTQHEGGGAVSLAEAHARASSVADGLGRVDAPGDSRLVGEAVARARAAADGVASRCRSADTTASEMEGRLQESRRNVDACRGRLRDDCELKRVKSDGLMSLTSELDEARSALDG